MWDFGLCAKGLHHFLTIKMDKIKLIQAIFLYLTAFVGVVLVTISTVSLVDLSIKTFVFNDRGDSYYLEQNCETGTVKYVNSIETSLTDQEIADCKTKAKEDAHQQWIMDTERTVSTNIALLIIGIPLWIWGWRSGRKIKQ